jgi:hypothetical protein
MFSSMYYFQGEIYIGSLEDAKQVVAPRSEKSEEIRRKSCPFEFSF